MTGLPGERIVAILAESAVPFSEVSAHRATLEEAYMELTRDAVEFRAASSRRSGAMTATITPYRSAVPAGRDGFAQLLRAEWTKFRTVRGWVIGTVAAAAGHRAVRAARRRPAAIPDVRPTAGARGRPEHPAGAGR